MLARAEKQTCRFHPNGCINDGIHTTTDTNDWRERFDREFVQDKDPNDRVNGWLARDNGNGTVSIARPEDLKVFIAKEIEKTKKDGYLVTKKTYEAVRKEGYAAGREEGRI